MKPVRFLRPAELEMLDAARYYEHQATRLGLEFLAKIETAVQDISEYPERWPVVTGNVRRRLEVFQGHRSCPESPRRMFQSLEINAL